MMIFQLGEITLNYPDHSKWIQLKTNWIKNGKVDKLGEKKRLPGFLDCDALHQRCLNNIRVKSKTLDGVGELMKYWHWREEPRDKRSRGGALPYKESRWRKKLQSGGKRSIRHLLARPTPRPLVNYCLGLLSPRELNSLFFISPSSSSLTVHCVRRLIKKIN